LSLSLPNKIFQIASLFSIVGIAAWQYFAVKPNLSEESIILRATRASSLVF
jgi:hypothetical protein